MRTKGKGKKRFAIVLALIMALQCMVFSTSVFASEGDVPPMEANQKMLTGVRLGDGKAGNGDGLYYCLAYTDTFKAIDSRYIPFETKLNSSQYEAADYDFTDQLLTYKGETYAYRPDGPQAGDGKDFHYYTISFMKVDKLAKSTYQGGYLVEGGHPSSWKLVTNLKKDESTGLWKEGYYHRDYQATLHVGDAPDAYEEIEEPAVEEPAIEEETEEIEEPVVEEPAIEEDTEEIEEPVVEEPAIEEEAEEIEEPAVEEPAIEEEAEEIEEPVVEEPAIEEPADTEEESVPADEETAEENTPAAPADDEDDAPVITAATDNNDNTPAAPAAVSTEDAAPAADIEKAVSNNEAAVASSQAAASTEEAAPAASNNQAAASTKEAAKSEAPAAIAENEAPAAAQTAVSSIEMNESAAPAAASSVEMNEDAAPAAAAIEEEAAPQTAATGYWALINLLLAIGAALMSLLTMGLHFTRRNVLTLIPAIAAIVIFFLTENMANSMRMVDDFTLLMAILFAANIILAVLSKKNSEDRETEQLAMAQ